MKNKLFPIFLVSLALSGCGTKTIDRIVDNPYSNEGYNFKELENEKVTVTFNLNINKNEINLNSGLYATGSSIALKVDQIEKGSKAVKPDIDPVRNNYDFVGWHKSADQNDPFDFDSETVNSNLVLFAHWEITQEETFIEPEYVVPSKIDDSISTIVEISGVLNMPIQNNGVKLSRAALARLVRDKGNILSSLNYKIKTGASLTASYNEAEKKISFSASKGGENQNGTITVTDDTSNLVVSNSTYEKKAKDYEDNSTNFEDYKIMLAGSSSMENWTTSTEDLLPLTTYNHGIGGTTIDQWTSKLNQRLVYPYNPKTVVYYVGVNNLINSKDSKEVTGNYLVEMFNDVHSHLPNTKIYWVLINALPGYMSYLPSIEYVNNVAKNYENSHDFLTTLDAGQLLLKENGQPNAAFFLTDGLHMSKYGYVLWGGYIKAKLIEDMK